MTKNGESVYGTRGGPIDPKPWGVTTQKPGKIYVHVLDWEDSLLALPDLPNKVKGARLLSNGSKVDTEQTKGGFILRLPKTGRDPIDTVVVLDTES